MVAGVGGGFLVGRDVGEHTLARIRDERIRGEKIRPVWLARVRARASNIELVPSRAELAGVAMLGALLVALVSFGSAPVVDRGFEGWLHAFLIATQCCVLAAFSGSLSKNRLIVPLQRGDLDDRLRSDPQ